MKALIVEDSKKFAIMLSQRLTNYGVKFEFASSAEEALEKFEIYRFDIAFIDINLPRMNGLHFLEKLRDQDQKVLPIMLTAEKSTMKVLESRVHGAFDYVYKPAIPDGELHFVMDKVSQHIQRWKDIARPTKTPDERR